MENFRTRQRSLHQSRVRRKGEYYDRQLTDPTQLLRVSGQSYPILHHRPSSPPPSTHSSQPEPKDIMFPWPGDGVTIIDRFDGRALLDQLPYNLVPDRWRTSSNSNRTGNDESRLNFLRYKDLLDLHRRHVVDSQFLESQNQTWHSFGKVKPLPGTRINYQYDTTPTPERNRDLLTTTPDLTKVSQLLTPDDLARLNSMATDFGIKNYSHLLFSSHHPNINPSRIGKKRLPLHDEEDDPMMSSQPTVVIEFTGEPPVTSPTPTPTPRPRPHPTTTRSSTTTTKQPPKKLTPLEIMREKVRQGLNQSIQLEQSQHHRQQQSQANEKLVAELVRPSSQHHDIFLDPNPDHAAANSLHLYHQELTKLGLSPPPHHPPNSPPSP